MTTIETATQKAENVAAAHNARETAMQAIYPNMIDHLTPTGQIRQTEPRRELIPNAKNPGLMDTATATSYEAEFTNTYRPRDGKRTRRSIIWYTVFTTYERTETGSHYAE